MPCRPTSSRRPAPSPERLQLCNFCRPVSLVSGAKPGQSVGFGNPLVAICWIDWSGDRIGSACLSPGARAADLAEVVGQNAPADPSFHAGLAVVAAAAESEAALEDTNA